MKNNNKFILDVMKRLRFFCFFCLKTKNDSKNHAKFFFWHTSHVYYLIKNNKTEIDMATFHGFLGVFVKKKCNFVFVS